MAYTSATAEPSVTANARRSRGEGTRPNRTTAYPARARPRGTGAKPPRAGPRKGDVRRRTPGRGENQAQLPAASPAPHPADPGREPRLDPARQRVEHPQQDHALPVVPPAEPRG